MRRVVVTGLGLVTPLGCGVKPSWGRLLEGACGIDVISSFDASDLSVKIAAEVPLGSRSDGKFDPDEWVDSKDRRKMGRFILYAVVAAQQAIEDAGWQPMFGIFSILARLSHTKKASRHGWL